MLERVIEILRGRSADRTKAREHLATQSSSIFREVMRDYDAFVPLMARVSEPAVLVGTAKDSMGNDVPVRVPTDELSCMQLVQGGTGTGKTTFVTSFVADALFRGRPVGVVDCKSGFFEGAVKWAGAAAYRMDPQRRAAFLRSLAVVNPFGQELVPLNICRVPPGSTPEVQAYEVSLVLSRLFDSSMGFQMENLLRHLLLLLTDAGLTLAEAPQILQDEVLRGILAERSASPLVKDFFLKSFATIPHGSKDALLARLQALLLPENLRLMLGADELLDLKGILDRGDPLIMFLGKGPGVPEEQVDIFGSLLLQFLFQAAFAGGARRRPVQIAFDEFFHLLEAPSLFRRFETGLTSFRSFGVMLTLVMHQMSQVHPSLRETMLGNCDLIAVFRTSGRNAQFFGDFLPELDPEIVARSLRKTGRVPQKYELRAQLTERVQKTPNRHCYWYDRRKPYKALLLRVPDLPEPHERIGTSATALDEFIKAEGIYAGGYALSKESLRRQIEERQKRIAEILRPPLQVSVTREPGPVAEKADAKAKPKARRPRLG